MAETTHEPLVAVHMQLAAVGKWCRALTYAQDIKCSCIQFDGNLCRRAFLQLTADSHYSSNSFTTILPFTRPSFNSPKISLISSKRRILISTFTLPSSTNAKARFASARVPTDDPTIREEVTTSWFELTVNFPSFGRPTQTSVERKPRYSKACCQFRWPRHGGLVTAASSQECG